MGKLAVAAVDDDREYLELLGHAIAQAGAEVVPCASLDALKHALGRVDAVVADYRVPTERDGDELVAACRARAPSMPIAVLSALDRAETAVRLMRLGANDYFVKPDSIEELCAQVGAFVRRIDGRRKGRALPSAAPRTSAAHAILAASPSLEPLLVDLSRAARTGATVLVTGESGTGKELVARAIHEQSPRREGPFVCVDCAAIPDALLENELFGHKRGAYSDARDDRNGLVAEAQHGTLFLDEIGELPLAVQGKLLRLLQTREYRRLGEATTRIADVRVVAATHRNLRALVRDGRFRQDLFYRLDVIRLTVPPLRERRRDIPLLAQHFLDRAVQCEGAAAASFSSAALELLTARPWEGNVRELENVVARIASFAVGPRVEAADVGKVVDSSRDGEARWPSDSSPDEDEPLLPYHEAKERAVSAFERAYAQRLLRAHNGRIVAAARAANIDRKSLSRLLDRVGLRGSGLSDG